MQGIGYGLSAGQIVSGLLIAYAVEMGVDPRVVTLAGRTAPGDMWVLTAAEAEAFNVSSRISDQPDWRLSVVRGDLALAGPGTIYPDTPYQAGIVCARGRSGWLQIDISIALRTSSFGPINAASLSQTINATGGRLGRSHEGQIALPMLATSVVGQRLSTTILLPPAAVSLLRTGGLSVGYDAPHVYMTLLPWMRIAGRPVVDAVDLLLRNCPG